MMKQKNLLRGIGLAFLLGSCATQPQNTPEWATAGISAVFPEADYIAQEGRGSTRAEAEAHGAAQIALFFNTRISSAFSSREQYREVDGSVQQGTEIATETFVQARIQVSGIRYAGDPYYDQGQQTWYTIAYIRRAEAWEIYEPRFKQQADTFHQLFQAGEQEQDPFKKALGYLAAQQYRRSGDFESADLFGQLLYPAKMNEVFGGVRQEGAALPQKLEAARRNAGVYIDCPLDFESRIRTAVGEAFTQQGFPVAKTPSEASAVCTVTVDEGEEKRELGIFYHPSLRAAVTGQSGAILSFSAQGERASAVTPELAKRRAYTALADKVQEAFASQFRALLQ